MLEEGEVNEHAIRGSEDLQSECMVIEEMKTYQTVSKLNQFNRHEKLPSPRS